MSAKKEIKKVIPDAIKALLNGYSVVRGVVVLKIDEENLGEYAPIYTLKTLKNKETMSFLEEMSKDGVTQMHQTQIIIDAVIPKIVKIDNLYDKVNDEFYSHTFGDDSEADSEIADSIPINVLSTIFSHLMGIAGLKG